MSVVRNRLCERLGWSFKILLSPLLLALWSSAWAGSVSVVELGSSSVVEGQVYFRPGELIVGQPDLASRPGLLPLMGGRSITLPQDLSAYENLSARCVPIENLGNASQVLGRGDLGADGRVESIVVRRPDPLSGVVLEIRRDDAPLTQSVLPLSVRPCKALVAEVEAGDVPELILIWTSAGPQGTTRGVTVFELQEKQP